MDREALQSWLEEGLSLEQIGRRVGRRPSTVAYWVQKHGLTAAHQTRHAARGGIPRETLEALVARHLTIREIAAEVERSPATIQHWLREYGLQTVRAATRPDRPTAPTRSRFVAQCRRHGRTEFVVRADGPARCLRCRADAVSERRRRVKAALVAEAGGACALCGYDRWIGALQFHHRDPRTKRFSVAARGVTRSLATARAEAAKCVLLCANCHAEVEAGIAVLPAKIPTVAADIRGSARSGVAQLADASGC